MSKYIIRGARALEGNVSISGAKNSVLPILASSLLNSGICVIKNVPMLSDTKVSLDILKSLGCKIDVMGNTVVVDSRTLENDKVCKDLACKMRSSIIFLGSILARCKSAKIYEPGGCKLGKRPIDFHIKALKKLGAIIEQDDDDMIVASLEKIKSCEISLPFASVGATQNIILASIFSDGKVVIKNSAKEPEIVDMVKFLRQMGADITGEGTDKITIKGVSKLKEYCEYTIMPDRIEAGTFLCMTAITGGKVLLEGANPNHLLYVIKELEKTGCSFLLKENEILCDAPKIIKPIKFLETKPYPYFPTDMQAQFVSLMCIANGESIIKENIFEARNKHISELRKFGADIKEKDNIFKINGKKEFLAQEVEAKELRGGAALITMALYIDGQSTINGASYIRRGYENIQDKLTSLGADIKYIKS